MTKPTILCGPREIQHFLKTNCSKCKYTLTVAPSCTPALDLKLGPTLDTWRFSNSLDANDLLEVVSEILSITITANILAKAPKFEVQRLEEICTEEPLQGVFEFSRAEYERKGSSCKDLVVSFCKGESNLDDELFTLGLHPNQLTSGKDEPSLSIFYESLMSISKEGERKVLMESLARAHPGFATSLDEYAVGLQLQSEKSERKSVFEETFSFLKERVIGQEYAVRTVASKLALHAAGQDEKCAVYLFVGPTGVGKTELAKAATQKKGHELLMFSMNQYQSEHSFSNLFGSPSGYVGSSDKPHMVKQLEEKGNPTVIEEGTHYLVKNMVILFDEFEKAHSKVKQSLLTLLDDDHFVEITYTKSRGTNKTVKYSFKSCCFIFTSNLFQEPITEAFEKDTAPEKISNLFRELNNSPSLRSSLNDLNSILSPELMGRFKTILPFGPIPRGSCYQKLVMLKLNEFLTSTQTGFKFKEVTLEMKDQVLVDLEKSLYGRGVDMRRVAAFFDNVKSSVGESLNSLGDPATKKMILTFSRENGLYLRWEIFSQLREDYTSSRDLPIIKLTSDGRPSDK